MAEFIVTVLGIILLTVVAVLVYGAGLAGGILSFLTGFLLVFMSLAAIFLFVPAVARTPRTASATCRKTLAGEDIFMMKLRIDIYGLGATGKVKFNLFSKLLHCNVKMTA
ncbi:hypothetical protein M1N11_04975 [Peptococcaceae bacterium]|nr:hypothetical protein [Peptococcaceae bacterium]